MIIIIINNNDDDNNNNNLTAMDILLNAVFCMQFILLVKKVKNIKINHFFNHFFDLFYSFVGFIFPPPALPDNPRQKLEK